MSLCTGNPSICQTTSPSQSIFTQLLVLGKNRKKLDKFVWEHYSACHLIIPSTQTPCITYNCSPFFPRRETSMFLTSRCMCLLQECEVGLTQLHGSAMVQANTPLKNMQYLLRWYLCRIWKKMEVMLNILASNLMLITNCWCHTGRIWYRYQKCTYMLCMRNCL